MTTGNGDCDANDWGFEPACRVRTADRSTCPRSIRAGAALPGQRHCARYGKVVKFLGAQAYYGGYISFACRWVPYGAQERPLRASY
jgi:hypothetical protein